MSDEQHAHDAGQPVTEDESVDAMKDLEPSAEEQLDVRGGGTIVSGPISSGGTSGPHG